MIKLLGLLFAAGKLGKLLTTGGTMIISIVLYSFVYGWRYAVGFVMLMFVHEMGHFVAARMRGLEVGLPTFIPFIGAWVAMKDMPHNVETEAYVGFAGPIAGMLGAIFCYWVARNGGSSLWLALAYSGFFINLINLIPTMPFDGGRITAIISPKLWLVGVPLLVALFFYSPSPLLILIGFLAYPQIIAAFKKDDPNLSRPEGYYDTPLNTRINYGVLYLGLVAFMAIMCFELHTELAAKH
ncbi:MAG: hypothetical protein RL748_2300 [Pseudomonadota bacterium]|jgi:Zn-dependent protease